MEVVITVALLASKFIAVKYENSEQLKIFVSLHVRTKPFFFFGPLILQIAAFIVYQI